MKEKKLTKKQIKKLEKRALKEKDKKWRNAIMQRDNFTCQVCNKKNLINHAHHILPRQFLEYKHDINNGICLCYFHHKVGKFSPHQNALWFDYWLYINNIEQWNYIHKIVKKLEEERNDNLSCIAK